MQGRIYVAADDKGGKGDVVTALAPVGGSSFGIASDSGSNEEDAGGGAPEDEGEYGEAESYEDESYEGDPDESEGGGAEEVRVDDGRAAASLLSATLPQELPPLSGQVVSLKAGTYVLETESARGDVGVGYGVSVAVRALLPGTSIKTHAPAVLDVKGPAAGLAGLVRIKTRGETDVACRLLDATGTSVASSSGSGADWNCALAVPLVAGSSYRLYVDAEVLRPGDTEVKAEFLEAKDTGALKNGDTFKLVGKVARATLVPAKGKVEDVTLTSSEDFSCAAFDGDGRLLDRQVGVRRCSLLLWGNDDEAPFTVMAWTADRPAAVNVALRERGLKGVGGFFGSSVDDDVVVTAKVSGRGRFETAPNARCLQQNKRGALVPCPTAASFDAAVDGDTVLVGVGSGEKADITFKERVAQLDKRTSEERTVSARKSVERQVSTQKALHLIDVQALPGRGVRPACEVGGGARVVDDDRCVAASGLTTESLLTTWTRPGGSLPVRLVQQSVVPPAATPLVVGTSSVNGAVRAALPAEPWRLDLAIPADTWAVLLDDGDRAVDVCAPRTDLKPLAPIPLSRCVLRGRGGSVVVARVGGGGFDVRADVIRFAAFDEPARLLSGLFELKPRSPGRERLRFAPSTTPRALRVEGSGVKACAIHTEDGGRIAGCRGVIAANLGGDIVVEHDGRAIRASLGKVGDLYGNRFGAIASTTSASLSPGRAEPLTGTVIAKSVTTPSRGVLRVRATGGVCAVADNAHGVVQSEGFGGGCDFAVVVDKGESRVLVRGFGGATLTGTVTVDFEAVTRLSEGVGKEVLVEPGEARVFEVTLDGDGELGVGIKVDAEVLDCALLNAAREVVADGCQIFGRFTKGSYFLRVTAPPDTAPRRFAPVVFGLKGADVDVPEDYLRDFFRRVPRPADASKEVR